MPNTSSWPRRQHPLPRRPAPSLLGALGAGLLLALGAVSPARAVQYPMQQLPDEKLAAMGPLLRHGEVALIESLPSGRLKQVTIVSLVAAPPQVVREVLTTPEKWPDFVPNVSRSKVSRRPDGSLDYDFELSLKVLSLETDYRMTPQADGTVEVHDNDAVDRSSQLWKFIAVPGGTVMVEYSFTDIYHSNKYVKKIAEAAPMTEHGLALAAQLAYVKAMKVRAEKLAAPGSFPAFDATQKSPGFNFLLERGRVAVIRTGSDGRSSDISILDNVYAPAERVHEVIAGVSDYARFVDGVKRAEIKSSGDGIVDYELRHDLSLVHMESRFRMRRAGNAVDVIGDSGDQRGSRYRWDLTQKGDKQTLVVFRASQDLSSVSPLIFGTIFRAAPFFEPGIAVAMGLVYVVGVRGHAEGWK